MKLFRSHEVEEAKAHALSGGQALHLHRIIVDRRTAPKCFLRAVDAGEDIAHLFDQDKDRLIATATRFGVKIIFVDDAGTETQHIDLCGHPLKKAKEEAALVAAGLPRNFPP